MSPRVQRHVDRFDALPTRQRVLIYVAVVLVLAFILDALLLSPARAHHKRLNQSIAGKAKEAAALKTALHAALEKSRPLDERPLRARQAELQRTLADVNERIAKERRRFTPPERMRDALEEMLRAHARLSLLELRTVPVVALGEGGVAGLYRHGMEITLAGTYVDFYDYLRALERLPTQLYWGKAEIRVSEHPKATLKLTVYTVSFDTAWLVV